MPEKDIEMQIFEELQKLKDIISKIREAENVYRNSSELLGKVAMQYSDLSILKDELNEHAHTTKENLHKIFSIWEQTNRKKMDNLDEEIEKLKISSNKDFTPQFNEFSEQVKKVNINLNSISEELNQLKRKQAANGIYIRIGFFLILIISFIILVFK